MYFYLTPSMEVDSIKLMKDSDGCSFILHGPYLTTADVILTAYEADGLQCDSDEYQLLEKAVEEIPFYEDYKIDIDTSVHYRTSLTTVEYAASYTYHKALSLSEWCESIGISTSIHNHIMGGRTFVKSHMAKLIFSMHFSQTFMNEISARFLSTLLIAGELPQNMQVSAFGRNSKIMSNTLKYCQIPCVEFYWRTRSYVDICQLYLHVRLIKEGHLDMQNLSWSHTPESFTNQAHASLNNKKDHPRKIRINENQKIELTTMLTLLKERRGEISSETKLLIDTCRESIRKLVMNQNGVELNGGAGHEDLIQQLEGLLGENRSDYSMSIIDKMSRSTGLHSDKEADNKIIVDFD